MSRSYYILLDLSYWFSVLKTKVSSESTIIPGCSFISIISYPPVDIKERCANSVFRIIVEERRVEPLVLRYKDVTREFFPQIMNSFVIERISNQIVKAYTKTLLPDNDGSELILFDMSGWTQGEQNAFDDYFNSSDIDVGNFNVDIFDYHFGGLYFVNLFIMYRILKKLKEMEESGRDFSDNLYNFTIQKIKEILRRNYVLPSLENGLDEKSWIHITAFMVLAFKLYPFFVKRMILKPWGN